MCSNKCKAAEGINFSKCQGLKKRKQQQPQQLWINKCSGTCAEHACLCVLSKALWPPYPSIQKQSAAWLMARELQHAAANPLDAPISLVWIKKIFIKLELNVHPNEGFFLFLFLTALTGLGKSIMSGTLLPLSFSDCIQELSTHFTCSRGRLRLHRCHIFQTWSYINGKLVQDSPAKWGD